MITWGDSVLLCANTEVNDYLRDQIEFARQIGKEHNLLQCIHRMANQWYQHQYVCILYKDFAKHSFGFACFYLKDIVISNDSKEVEIHYKPNAEPFMNGGLIYTGPDQSDETFSVQLNKSDGWSIHT